MKPRLDLYTNDNTCVKVYDPSQKKLIGVYSTFRKASDKIGITEKILRGRAESKTRIYSEYYKMDVAIRHSALKQGDDILINKTLKNIKL
jgi:hypothetical protein